MLYEPRCITNGLRCAIGDRHVLFTELQPLLTVLIQGEKWGSRNKKTPSVHYPVMWSRDNGLGLKISHETDICRLCLGLERP